MFSNISYRRLVVIDMLHNYYLDENGVNYFELPLSDQEKRLNEVLKKSRYNLMEQITVEPVEDTRRLLAAHRIILKKSAQGFFLVVAVKEIRDDSGLRYKPVIPLNGNMRMQFKIKVSNLISFITNTRLRPVFPAMYFLTNSSMTTGKVYPSLAAPTPKYREGYMYAMGETTIVNDVAQRAVRQTNNPNEGWAIMNDIHETGEQDRILLPKAFRYLFQVTSLTQVRFELRKNDQTLKTIVMKNETGLKEAMINFEKADNGSIIESGMYTLLVSGNDNYKLEHTVYLDDSLYNNDAFALIDIVPMTVDPAFSLLDADGLLSNHHPSGCPMFELRLASRSTYWNYYFKDKPPDITDPLWEDSEVPAGFSKSITSTIPFALSQDYRKLNYGKMILPNPNDTAISLKANKIYSDILIN
jgi:hypothetical protein